MRFTDNKKIDQKTGRAINRRLILNLIRREGSLSRTDLSERTGLSPAAVGFVVADLIEDGFLVTGESKSLGSGRKPVPLRLNKEGQYSIGVKVGPNHLDCVLTDFGINIVDTRTVSISNCRPETVVKAAASAIREFSVTIAVEKNILGIGLSVPGRIDPLNGTCIRSNRLGWDDVPIAHLVSAATNIPAFVEDDTLAYGLAHHMFGLGQTCQNFAVLAVGDGIGFATITESKVWRGNLGNAGKVGHVLFNEHGPMCECGRNGCLQAWFSATAVETRWNENNGQPLAVALRSADASALTHVAQAGHAIGMHLAEWATVTDPERIVLGGEAVSFGPGFIDAMREALTHAYYRESAPPIVVDEASFYWTAGAAAVAVQQIFDFEARPTSDKVA